jgi:anti-sigma regulatory factor (Ser/Thr protein kinase)
VTGRFCPTLPSTPSVVAELTLQIAGGPDAPGDARTALRRAHPELPPELMQVVVLLASELVSNAVKHAASSSIAVRCAVTPQCVRLEVADQGPGFVPDPGPIDPSHAGGWGLHLVDELSSRWGVADGPGSRVWFEIDR